MARPRCNAARTPPPGKRPPTPPLPPKKRYGQAGTPQLAVTTSYDAAKQTFTVAARQRTPATNGQPDKVPVMIPVKVRKGGRGAFENVLERLELQGGGKRSASMLHTHTHTHTHTHAGGPPGPRRQGPPSAAAGQRRGPGHYHRPALRPGEQHLRVHGWVIHGVGHIWGGSYMYKHCAQRKCADKRQRLHARHFDGGPFARSKALPVAQPSEQAGVFGRLWDHQGGAF